MIFRLLIYIVACAVGGLTQAVSGFGFVIIVMMIFPHILPSYRMCVAVCGVLSFLSSGYLAVKLRRNIKFLVIAAPAAAYLFTSTAVIVFISYQPDALLKKLLAAALIALSVYFMFFGGRFKIKPSFPNGVIFGSFSGILGGLFSLSGPPIVIYLAAASGDNDTYMANLQAYFAVTSLYSTVIRFIMGSVGPSVIYYSAAGIAAVFAGLYFGNKLFKKLDSEALRRVIYAVMALSGVTALF